MKARLKVILHMVTILLLFGAGNNSLPLYAEEVPQNVEVVKYQTEKDYPPFKYNDNFSLTGFDIDFSRLIFLKTDYDLQFSTDTWPKVYERLLKGEIDTCGMLAVSSQRKDEILFSQTVYQSHLAVYTKKNPGEKNYSEFLLKDLNKYRIGVGTGQYSEDVLGNELGLKPYATFETVEEGVKALENGKIDVLFENQEVVNYILIKDGLKSEIEPRLTNLYPIDVAYGVRKDDTKLVAYINKRIDALEKSGVYEELYQRYFFTHSPSYTREHRNSVIFTVVLCAMGIVLILLLLQAYIGYLRRKLTLEQGFSKDIISNAKILIIVSQLDGVVIMFNRHAQAMTGFDASEIEGKKLYDTLIPEDKREQMKEAIEKVTRTALTRNLEYRILCKDGSYIDTLWSNNIFYNTEGKPLYIISMGIDITDQKKTEKRLRESYEELEATHEELVATEEELKQQYDDLRLSETHLKQSEERYKLAVDGVNDGIWDWDMKNDNLFMSKRCRTMLGYEENSCINTYEAWKELIHGDDKLKVERALDTYLAEPRKKHFQVEYRAKTKNGEYKWIRTRGKAIWDADGKATRMAGSHTDVTEQKTADEKIHHMAYYDSLTGLPNRTLFLDRFFIAISNAQRKNRMLAVYFLDLDNFKTVNDTLGHSSGDKLLSIVGDHLKMHMRKGDTVARLGGDEFILLQPNIREISEVTHVAGRLLNMFRQPWMLDGHEFYVTASIGITVYPDNGDDVQTLMKNADSAMYRAKELGKNNFQLYTNSLNTQIIERLDMENSLRKAIERDELVMHYQPLIELSTGKTIGVEALIRWFHPVLGLIHPRKFIPLAEESGLIISMGEWILKTACLQGKKLHDAGYAGLRMSVNLSARQFQQKNLLEMIAGVIDETRIRPEWLELEITESIAMKDLDYTISVLHNLKGMGVGVSLDDFGTGYSSLNYLRLLPINNLKIDKSFVREITAESSEAVIAKALISLAHNLNLKVTGEGVETLEQCNFLKSEKCDMVQGYLFSVPLPAYELEAALDKGNCVPWDYLL